MYGDTIRFGFGGGSDLRIGTDSNTNLLSYSNLGWTYKLIE